MSRGPVSISAPAKLNLFLHVTGRREDGYHFLQSLVAFADLADLVIVSPADEFSFKITGPFADDLRQSTTESENLVVQAATALAASCERDLFCHIELFKNIPVASGVGGGSADAAAVIRALMEFWKMTPESVPDLSHLLISLGSDVPCCYASSPAVMEGTGETLKPVKLPQNIPALVVNPRRTCSTQAVFAAYEAPFRASLDIPEAALTSIPDLALFLEDVTSNDLSAPACGLRPEIRTILHEIAKTKDCLLSRMSGSGATCYGLFQEKQTAQSAAKQVQAAHPDWWVKCITLNPLCVA